MNDPCSSGVFSFVRAGSPSCSPLIHCVRSCERLFTCAPTIGTYTYVLLRGAQRPPLEDAKTILGHLSFLRTWGGVIEASLSSSAFLGRLSSFPRRSRRASDSWSIFQEGRRRSCKLPTVGVGSRGVATWRGRSSVGGGLVKCRGCSAALFCPLEPVEVATCWVGLGLLGLSPSIETLIVCETDATFWGYNNEHAKACKRGRVFVEGPPGNTLLLFGIAV